MTGIAFYYSGTIKDRIKITQMNNCANKIVSTSESIFYAGEPSKTSITCYFPQGLSSVQVSGSDLVFVLQVSTGLEKTAFSSKVPLSGTLGRGEGLKKIYITARESDILLNSA